MPTSIQYPSQKMTSVGTTLRFQILPVGSRRPTVYTVSTAADQAPVAGIAIGATDILVGAISIGLAAPVTLPDKAKLVFANGVSVRIDGAVTAATTIAVKPVKSITTCADSGNTIAIPAGTAGVYNHGLLAANSEYLPVEPLPTALFPGEFIVFDAGGLNVGVNVTNYAPRGAVTLETFPLADALFAGALAQTLGTFAVTGGTDASPSSQPKVVDGTNFSSGAGYEGVSTGTNRTLNFTFQNILGDPGSDALKSILYNDEFYNREIYAILKRDSVGNLQPETYEGACIATQGDQSSPVQDLITISANLQFQGGAFTFTPPSGAYDICNPDNYCPVSLPIPGTTGPSLNLTGITIPDSAPNTLVLTYNNLIDPGIVPATGDYTVTN